MFDGGKEMIPGSCRKLSLGERLLEEKQLLEKRLADLNKALDILAKYPEVAEVVNIISKI